MNPCEYSEICGEQYKELEQARTDLAAARAECERLKENAVDQLVATLTTPLSVFGGVSALEVFKGRQGGEGVAGTLRRMYGNARDEVSDLRAELERARADERKYSFELQKEVNRLTEEMSCVRHPPQTALEEVLGQVRDALSHYALTPVSQSPVLAREALALLDKVGVRG